MMIFLDVYKHIVESLKTQKQVQQITNSLTKEPLVKATIICNSKDFIKWIKTIITIQMEDNKKHSYNI